MAHVIVSNIVSLDGYYEGPTHGVMELPMDAAFDAGPRETVVDALAAIDGECVVFGSRTMWNGLLRLGLVDELHLMVGARVLGGGTPLFAQPAALELRDVHRFDGSDNIRLVYAPRR